LSDTPFGLVCPLQGVELFRRLGLACTLHGPGVCTISFICFDVSYCETFEESYEISNVVIPANTLQGTRAGLQIQRSHCNVPY
jgi:hypothetical protein